MKKFIVIMLIAILAVGGVFAADLTKLGANFGWGYTTLKGPASEEGRAQNTSRNIEASLTYEVNDAVNENKTFYVGFYGAVSTDIPVSAYYKLTGKNGHVLIEDGYKTSATLDVLPAFNMVGKLTDTFSLQLAVGPEYKLYTVDSVTNNAFGFGALLQGNVNITDGFALNLGIQGSWFPSALSTAQEMRDGKVDTLTHKIYLGGSCLL